MQKVHTINTKLIRELYLLHDEAEDLIVNDNFGIRITALTRTKLLKHAIQLLKLIKRKDNTNIENLFARYKRLVKLQMFQLNKLGDDGNGANYLYFKSLTSLFYRELIMLNFI